MQGPATDRGKLDEIRAALTQGESIRVELLNYRKDGTEFWVELDVVPVGGDGWPDYWLSVQRETIGRVQSERERRESERRLRTIIAQYGSDMITILDPEGTAIYESPQVERTLGYRHGELSGGYLYRYVHPDDAGRLAEAVERTLQTPGVNPPVEYRVQHADGSWLHLESIGNNLAGDPEVNAIVVNTRDITRRKQAEEALARERNLLETVVDSARDAIFVKDLEHRFLLSNRAHMEINGVRSREEILGKTNMDFWGEEGTAPHHADDRRVMETGEPLVGREEPIRTAAGEERWLSTTKVPLRGPEGEVEGVVAISRDITEKYQAEQALKQSEERYHQLFEQSADALLVHDAEGKILNCNPQACYFHSYTHQEMLSLRIKDLTDDLLSEEEKRGREESGGTLWQRILAGDAGLYQGIHLGDHKRKDGTKFPVEVSVCGIDYGERRMILASVRDITERRRAEQALRENEELLRAVTGGAPVILFALDRDGVITLSEGKGLAAVGERPGDAVGYSLFESYGHLPEVAENVRRVLSGEDVAATVEVEGLAFEVRYSPIRDSGGGITGAIGVATDVTERRELERELEHRAFHDPLTDLPNRALFKDRLSHALKRTDRRRGPVAVLFMDLDGFKAVNDLFGHDEGDRVLVEFARRLRECLRPEDTVSRFGGDEFAVLLENAGHEESGEVAERILEVSRVPFILEGAGSEASITISIGIAHSTSSRQAPAELLRVADRAMYRAKADGKNTHRHG